MRPRQHLVNLFKLTVAHTLYALGLLRLWQKIALRRRAVVLMYHRVLTPAEQAASGSHPALVVDPETFARQMQVLKRWFRVLSVAELLDHMERGVPLPSCSCVITADDGWSDNYHHMLPILREHGLPALVFLPVNYIGTRRLFWQEALTHLLVRAVRLTRQDATRRPALARILDPVGLGEVLDAESQDPRPAIVARLGEQKERGRAAVTALLGALADELGVRLERLSEVDGFIDWEQADEMARHGVTFGGHGAEHLLLTQVADADVDRELATARDVLIRRYPSMPLTYSYPNGYYTADVVARTRAAGYRLGFITRRGFVRHDDSPLEVKRLNIHQPTTRTTPLFLARVLGLL